MSVAVLLIAHGSRRSAANEDLVLLADEIRHTGRYRIIEVSYLELAEPTIDQAGRRCVAAGATEVLMMPYFLSAGMHVVEDLQKHRRQLAEEFPSTQFQLCPPLGLHPLMAEIVLARLNEGQQSAGE
jgi:sirohydrochlorin ferrochelatase